MADNDDELKATRQRRAQRRRKSRIIRVVAEYVELVKPDTHKCIMENPYCECRAGSYCELLPPLREVPDAN